MTNRHADFEALSAFVDGEAPEWADHVAGCESCRATTARLRAVAGAVGAPLEGPPSATREAAVAAALEGFSAGGGAADRATPAAGTAGGPPRPRLAPERPASGRPRASRPWAMPAVAAVIVGVLGFSGLVLSSYRSSDESSTVAGPTLEADASARADSGVGANAPAVPVVDLGDVPDTATLRARAQFPAAAIAPTSSSGASGSANSGAASDTGVAAPGAPTSSGVGQAAPLAGSGSPVTPGSGGAAGSLTPTTTLTQRSAGSNVVGTRPCEDRARARDPALREVVYFATARQGPEPAFVLGFVTGPAQTPVTLLLMLAQDDCAELLRTAGP